MQAFRDGLHPWVKLQNNLLHIRPLFRSNGNILFDRQMIPVLFLRSLRIRGRIIACFQNGLRRERDKKIRSCEHTAGMAVYQADQSARRYSAFLRFHRIASRMTHDKIPCNCQKNQHGSTACSGFSCPIHPCRSPLSKGSPHSGQNFGG